MTRDVHVSRLDRSEDQTFDLSLGLDGLVSLSTFDIDLDATILVSLDSVLVSRVRSPSR